MYFDNINFKNHRRFVDIKVSYHGNEFLLLFKFLKNFSLMFSNPYAFYSFVLSLRNHCCHIFTYFPPDQLFHQDLYFHDFHYHWLSFRIFFFTSSMLSLVFLAITFSQLQAKKSVTSKLLSLIVDLKKLWNKNQINTAHEKSNHFFYKKASLRKFREW